MDLPININGNWTHTSSALLDVQNKIKCFICKDIPVDPHILWCKHSFCKNCIVNKNSCPKCGHLLSSHELAPDYALSQLLQFLSITSQVVQCDQPCGDEGVVPSHQQKDSEARTRRDNNNQVPGDTEAKEQEPENRTPLKDKRTPKSQPVLKKFSAVKEINDYSPKRAIKRRNSMSKQQTDVKEANTKTMPSPSLEEWTCMSIPKPSPKKVTSASTSHIPDTPVERKILKERKPKSTPKSAVSEAPNSVIKKRVSSSKSVKTSAPDEIVNRTSKPSDKEGTSKQTATLSVKDKSSISTPKRSFNEGNSNKTSKATDNNKIKSKGVISDLELTPKRKCFLMLKSPVLYSVKKSSTTSSTEKVNAKGETPLQIACRQGKLALVNQLLTEGAEANVKDFANWTPLCDAVNSGRVEVVEALLRAGAGVNTPANLNTTPLVEAVVRRDRAMVLLLMRHGADPQQRTALNNTAWSIADEEMREVLSSAPRVPSPPPPHVPSLPRSVLITSQTQDTLDVVMVLCQQFSLPMTTVMTEETTHVVVERTGEGVCPASSQVMQALLRGCCVVGVDWAAACLEQGRLLSVDGYEPTGTTDLPNTDVFKRARLNKEHLFPRLFDGCHISLQHNQKWRQKSAVVELVRASGAVYQARECDPERVPPAERTVMFHATADSPLAHVSHLVLYQPGPHEPQLRYNMDHVKSKPLDWFTRCIKTFSLSS